MLASLHPAERRDYLALRHALTQNFCPSQRIHLYQAELKTRVRKPNESLADLGRDISRISRLAYPTADQATRETIGINAFLDAIPGPAVEIRLNVVRGHPATILEAVALALEVEAILEAGDTRKSTSRRPQIHQVDDGEKPHNDARAKRMNKTIERLESEVRELKSEKAGKAKGKRPSPDRGSYSSVETRTCYRCGKQGHLIKDCTEPKDQGNEGGRPQSQ